MESKPPLKTRDSQFRVALIFAIIVGSIGGLMFGSMAVSLPLHVLQNRHADGDLGALPQVTVVGWLGLALVLRFVFRPRLVLRDGELLENRLFLARRFPLSAVKSIDRVEGKVDTVKGGHVDFLYLFREHPHSPWVVDLGMVEEPSRFMVALQSQCRVTYGNYSPKTAPPWAR